MVLAAVVASSAEKLRGVRDVVPGNVGEDAVLDVASEDAFLREGDGELSGVDTPSKGSTRMLVDCCLN